MDAALLEQHDTDSLREEVRAIGAMLERDIVAVGKSMAEGVRMFFETLDSGEAQKVRAIRDEIARVLLRMECIHAGFVMACELRPQHMERGESEAEKMLAKMMEMAQGVVKQVDAVLSLKAQGGVAASHTVH